MVFRRRRDRGTWLVDFRIAGVRYRHALPGGLSREQVKIEEELLRAEARRTAASRSAGPNVGEAIERYWHEHGQRLASWRVERSNLMAWSRALDPSTPIATVTRDDIVRIIASWHGGLSARGRPFKPQSVNRRLDVLQRLWGRAEELWQWPLARIPWRRLRAAEPPPRPRAPTSEQLAAYLAAMPERSRPLVTFLSLTGLRLGGARSVTRASIDWSRGVINAVSKGSRPTTVPITDEVRQLLDAIKPLPDLGCIWRVSLTQLHRDHERARAQVGLPELRLHDLRHAFAQMLEDAGEGEAITEALHHSSPRLRRRYAEARLEMTRQAIERARRR